MTNVMKKTLILKRMYSLHDSITTVLPQLGTTLLDAAKTQAHRLETSDDSEALHDFRVSVRHLRSFLKSYEPYLKRAKKQRQRFSEIMELTNAGRDNEVHIAWLKEVQHNATEIEHVGIAYLLEHLSNNDHVDLEKVSKQFAKAADKLAKIFSSDKENSKKEELNFAAITSSVLTKYSKHFQTLLQKISSSEDEEVHEARIAGKHLRYTLELLEDENATALVKRLKKFQDSTGNLHDLQVLAPKVESFLFAETTLWAQAFRDGAKTLSHDELSQLPELQRSYGLAEVMWRLEAEKSSCYNHLQTNWLGEASNDFFTDLTLFIKQLAESTQEDIAENAPASTMSRVKKAKKTQDV